MKIKNLTGKVFFNLTVICRVPNKTKSSRWLCKCSCGNYKEVDSCHLQNGGIKSCGCLLKNNKINKTHGMSKTRLYETWHGMKARCYNKNNINYSNYGGRGIFICSNWLNNFMNFYNWAINNGYKDNLTIDRIDVNGNYCPENCRWITIKKQANNKRTNIIIEYNGKKHTVSEWAEILKIKRCTLEKRLKTKTVREAFEKEIDKNKSHPKTFEEWCKK